MYGKNTVNELSEKKSCTLNTPKNSFKEYTAGFGDNNLTDQYP